MQIVIEIPDDTYEYILNGSETSIDEGNVVDAVRNGTPLDETDNSVLAQLKYEIQERGFSSPLMNPVFTMTEILEIIDKHIQIKQS